MDRFICWATFVAVLGIFLVAFVPILVTQITSCGRGHDVLCAVSNTTLVCNVLPNATANGTWIRTRYCGDGDIRTSHTCCRFGTASLIQLLGIMLVFSLIFSGLVIMTGIALMNKLDPHPLPFPNKSESESIV